MNKGTGADSILKSMEGRFGDAMRDRAVLAYLEVTNLIDKVANNEVRLEAANVCIEEFLQKAGKAYLTYSSTNPATMLQERAKITDRAHILAVLRARDAAEEPDVIGFRKDVLNGKLLSPQAISAWIDTHAKSGVGSSYAEIVLAENESPAFDKKTGTFVLTAKRSLTVTGQTTKFLEYGSPEGWVKRVPAKAGSTIDHLRHLSERLAVRYRWQKAQATNFILTDAPPFTAGVESSVSLGPTSAVITLSLDVALTPRQVADAYRRIKKALLKSQRTKQLSIKHMRLATFSHAQDWKQEMAKWNKKNPKWKYQTVAIFRRDALKARERLLSSGAQSLLPNLLPKKLPGGSA
jgi:hypothetical protein